MALRKEMEAKQNKNTMMNEQQESYDSESGSEEDESSSE